MMGSDSDWPRIESCYQTLKGLEVDCDVRVLSAHPPPAAGAESVRAAPGRGVRVFICAAGGAAHLAGAVAAHTTLPVLGIPIDIPPLNGLDALLATVQMPGGVPVATFGTGSGGPVNAALFAARLLALSDPELDQRVKAHRKTQSEKVAQKDAALRAKLA
jgi:5-(carboxyamino)imidazole ribonucleotide mutase